MCVVSVLLLALPGSALAGPAPSWAHQRNCNGHGMHNETTSTGHKLHAYVWEARKTNDNCSLTPLRRGHPSENRLARVFHLDYGNEGQRSCPGNTDYNWHCHKTHYHNVDWCHTGVRCDSPARHLSGHWSGTWSSGDGWYQTWHNLDYHCMSMGGGHGACPW